MSMARVGGVVKLNLLKMSSGRMVILSSRRSVILLNTRSSSAAIGVPRYCSKGFTSYQDGQQVTFADADGRHEPMGVGVEEPFLFPVIINRGVKAVAQKSVIPLDGFLGHLPVG